MPVQVIHGANEGYFPVDEMSVSQVALQLRDVFNIPTTIGASVNGVDVSGTHVVHDGDKIEFIPADGQKGGIHDFWTEAEVTAMFGDDAIDEMKEMGFQPMLIHVYPSDEIAAWQAKRSGKPKPPKHGLVIDKGTFSFQYQDQEPVVLGNTILYRLLARLARCPGIFVHFDALRKDAWNDDQTDDGTVSRTIRRLREKLDEHGVVGITLETQRHHVRLQLD